MIVLKETYERIKKYMVGAHEFERGGYIAKNYSGIVCDFVPDLSGEGKYYFYPSEDVLFESIERWTGSGFSFAGIIHSHPNGGSDKLSVGDEFYASKLFKLNPFLKEIYLPIYFENKLYVYKAFILGDGIQILEEDIVFVDDR